MNVPEKIRPVCLGATATVRDALIALEKTHREIALVIDADGGPLTGRSVNLFVQTAPEALSDLSAIEGEPLEVLTAVASPSSSA